MPEVFCGSKLKIERANKHIQELGVLFQEFAKTDFCKLHIEPDPNAPGNQVLKFEATKPIPKEIPLVMGDSLHNLHAALDLMACEIVSRAGGTPSRYLTFPFRDTRQDLVGTINGGEIKAAGQEICDLIVDTVKPYRGGNDALYALHDLDILDKHRLLIPIFSVVALTGIRAEDNHKNVFNIGRVAIGPGGKINMISIGTKLEIREYGQPAFGVFFGKDQPLEGQPVIPTLHQLAQLVSGVIQTIEKSYLTKS